MNYSIIWLSSPRKYRGKNEIDGGGLKVLVEGQVYFLSKPLAVIVKAVRISLMDAKNKHSQQRHSRETCPCMPKAGSGNPERKTGFRVKPGMTDLKVLRKWHPDTTMRLGSDSIASTVVRFLEG
jgi:hypothetical protein